MENQPKIKVIVRKRPLSKREIQKNDPDIIEVRSQNQIVVKEAKQKVDLTKYIEEHHFNFDAAYDEDASNEQIYIETVRPIVELAFNQYRVTCFAYGQTGSGKTFTMMGVQNTREVIVPGMFLLASNDIFNMLQQQCYQNLQIHIAFYEIYCGKLYDLLNDRNQLFAREDSKQNVNIVGLQEKKVMNVQQLMQLIEFGLSNRVVGTTGANVDSSRSHGILQISLKTSQQKVHGKISFIDLAGSERGADVVDSCKQTRLDGAEINKSLLALKECIRALDQVKRHTPFRGSKLTQVLKDSFIGKCKTVMVANISPTLNNCEHTLNTLRYADRVKELKKAGDTNGNTGGLTDLDLLAKQLMLPRQDKNTIKIMLDQNNNETNINTNNYNYNTNSNNINNQNSNSNNNYNSNYNQFGQKKEPLQYDNFLFNNNVSNQLFGKVGNSLFENDTNQELFDMNPRQQEPKAINMNINHNVQMSIGQSQPQSVTKKQQQQQQQPKKSIQQQKTIVSQFQPNKQTDKDILEMSVEQIQQLQANNDNDLQLMSQKHEQLIGIILTEEENVIGSHRQHIDEMVDVVKQEMLLLHEVDKPGSDIDDYVDCLDKLLAVKLENIMGLRNKVNQFREHLKKEEVLSKKFYEQRQEIISVHDKNPINNENLLFNNSGDIQLLDEVDFNKRI